MMVTQLIALVLVLVAAVAMLIYGLRHRGRTPEPYPSPAFKALHDEVGRAAEEGKLIHIAIGKGNLLTEDAMTSVAALQGLSALMGLAAAYDTPPILTAGDPTLYLLAHDRLRTAYARIGNASSFRPAAVQFVAPSPMTYAAMAATYLYDQPIGTQVTLGVFDQEAALLSDATRRNNARAFGGTASVLGLAALYPDLGASELVIGEEMFSGGAAVTQRLSSRGSLWAQDVLRWLIVVGIVGVAAASLLGLWG